MSDSRQPHPTVHIRCSVNTKEHGIDAEPRELLIDVLRTRLELTGTKRSCDVEVCGACTVLVDGAPVSSCTTLFADVAGKKVTTIEALAEVGALDPVQKAFMEHGALQCGFCTPGMILTVKSLLARDPHPSEEKIRHYLRGNLCRCTGYAKIIEAVKDLAGSHNA